MASAQAEGHVRPRNALRYRGYALLWGGAALSNAGRWMQQIAVPYVIFDMTRSTTWVGAAAFASLVPNVIVSPLAGAIADRVPRRHVLLAMNGFAAITAAALMVVWIVGIRDPLLILSLGAASMVSVSSSQPAWQSLIVEVVPAESITSAVSLNSVQASAGKAIGPAVGGIVLAALGPAWAFGANAVSFVFILAPVLMVPASLDRTSVSKKDRVGLLEGIREGGLQVWTDRQLRLGFANVVAVTFLANPLQQLVAPLAVEVFSAGPAAIGALTGAFGAGSVLGAFFVPRLAGADVHKGPIVPAIAALGVFMAGSVWVPWLEVAVTLFFIQGIAFVFAISSLLSVFHLNSPSAIRARVMSLFFVALGVCMGTGSLIQSAFADVVGLPLTVATAGAVLLLVGAAQYRPWRHARTIDKQPATLAQVHVA